MYNYKPLHDKVLIKRIKKDNKTQSGLFLADTGEQPISHGEVIAIGFGLTASTGERIALDVEIGEEVIFPSHCGMAISDDIVLLREGEILALVKE